MLEILRQVQSTSRFDIVSFDDACILHDPVDKWPLCEVLLAFFSQGFPLEKAKEYVRLRQPLSLVRWTLAPRIDLAVGPWAGHRLPGFALWPLNLPLLYFAVIGYVLCTEQNNLDAQDWLRDREKVHRRLLQVGVEQPQRLLVNWNDASVASACVERADELEVRSCCRIAAFEPSGCFVAVLLRKAVMIRSLAVDADSVPGVKLGGVVLHKPFVEKPVDADDHNVNVYYPASAGGGRRRLFRKEGDRSSEFDPDVSTVRRDGAYLYEPFLSVDRGLDIKVYVLLATRHVHAEARKSPAVDGRVERLPSGREVRYEVQLTAAEHAMVLRVADAFGQAVCGMDLLRARSHSVVCDVNGWSFVKDSPSFLQHCAQSLVQQALAGLGRAPPAP